jgi:arylsulfate sulfotransferase
MAKIIRTRVLGAAVIAVLASGLSAGMPQVRTLLGGEIDIVLNPTGISPLSAVASFETQRICDVQVRVPGREEVVHLFKDGSTLHEVPILGLYADRMNVVFLTLIPRHGTPETKVLTVLTGPLPPSFPAIDIETADPSRMEPGMTFCILTLSGTPRRSYPLMFDRNGEIRWYLDMTQYSGSAIPFERLSDGNFVFGLDESIYEYDMLGRLAARIDVPYYNFHHDIREIPGNRFVAAVDKEDTTIINSKGVKPSIEDHVIEIDRETGNILTEWDLREILDVSRNEAVNSNGDWFHNNSVWYSPDDHCLILSGRHQGVVKVTWDNQLVWIFAPRSGWGPAGRDGTGPETAPYLLTAVDADGNPYPDDVQNGDVSTPDFDWSWGQHNAQLTSGATMALFDNGDFRNWITAGPYSRFAEYRIDEAAMTVSQVWDYGKDRGTDLFSRIISCVDVLPVTGNRSMSPGIILNTTAGNRAKFVEVTYPDGEVVFEATIRFRNYYSPAGATGVLDNIYRSHRMSIYP